MGKLEYNAEHSLCHKRIDKPGNPIFWILKMCEFKRDMSFLNCVCNVLPVFDPKV